MGWAARFDLGGSGEAAGLGFLLEFLQREAEVGHTPQAALRVFAQAPGDEPLELGRNSWGKLVRRLRFLVEDGRHRGCGRSALEGLDAGRHLCRDRTKGEDIGAGVDGLPSHPFGRRYAMVPTTIPLRRASPWRQESG